MSLPKIKVKTIIATLERAQQREGMDDYTMRMVGVITRENENLMGTILTLLDGFVKMEQVDDNSAVRCLTCISIMYDCMKTQSESDELSEMFLEDEENASS